MRLLAGRPEIMETSNQGSSPLGAPARNTAAFLICLVWLAVIALAVGRLRRLDGIMVAIAGVAASALTLAICRWAERARWRIPVERLTAWLRTFNARRQAGELSSSHSDLGALVEQIELLSQIARQRSRIIRSLRDRVGELTGNAGAHKSNDSLTRSGLLDAPSFTTKNSDPTLSGDYSTLDMVNRLEPLGFHWIESSQAEQAFLGWTLAELRQKSFLDVIHPEDQPRAQAMLRRALERGEALGLIVRLQTAEGQMRAVEVNIGARYGTNQRVTHLRCNLTDVTEKVQAEREQKLRTRELTQVNEQLRRINRELEEVKNRLAQANAELSLKNRELDEFVHVVSHDLQEPLRTLIAFSDFLLKDYGHRLEPEGQEFVKHLVDASRRMRAMIHGMLNLSRAGKVVGGFESVDLSELVSVIRTDLKELLRSRNAQLHIVEPLPMILGDRDRVGQLLANLITNAIKYNNSTAPYVEVGATASAALGSGDGDSRSASAQVTIYVKDNGIGIEPQFHATVFQLFRRLHTQSEYEGTGVGLAICAKIVQAHGGRIWVESSPGQGSTFYVSLRQSPSPVPAAKN
jgi:PAS domain S-box-containing protein